MDLAHRETGPATRDGKGPESTFGADAEAGFCKPLLAAPIGGEGVQRRLRKATGISVRGFEFFPSIAGVERQGWPAMSGAGGALRHRCRAALAVQRPRRRMLSPGNPRACHIHQHQQRMQCRTARLLQHPSAKRGARCRKPRVLRLCWVLTRSPV